MKYTSQTETDMAVLFECLKEASSQILATKPCIGVLEIGIFDGCTGRAIRDWCKNNRVKLVYFGIDNATHPDFVSGRRQPPKPFPEAELILGDSAEVFHLLPNNLDVVLVDGCHCVNHTILDTVHYGRKVRPGGFLLFHDTSPEIQQTMKDPHGPDIPEFHNSVLLGHQLIHFPSQEWKVWRSDYQRGHIWGGMTAYQKTA